VNRWAKVSVIAAPAPPLMGCPGPGAPDALIHYSQHGICKSVGNYIAPDYSAIVLFRINQVDNSQVSYPWTFNGKAFLRNPPSACQYNVMPSGAIPINANGTVVVDEVVGIVMQTVSDNGSDDANADCYLFYAIYNQPPSISCQAALNVSIPAGTTYPVPDHPGTISISDAPPARTNDPNCGNLIRTGSR
jgi:hypothetical protein